MPDEMAVTQAEMELVNARVAAQLLGTEAPPFSFTYGGRDSTVFLPHWRREVVSRDLDTARVEHCVTWTDSATALAVRCVAVQYRDFPVAEWTLFFRNGGTADTPIIGDVQALDAAFPQAGDGDFVLRYAVGSPAKAWDYAPLRLTFPAHASAGQGVGPSGVTDLAAGNAPLTASGARLATCGGRPSDAVMPYFNLTWPGGGVIIAIGWPGQWAATFVREESSLRVRAGQEETHFTLHPGEEVRGPLIVLQFHTGDFVRSQNIWRRWMLAHNLPRPGGELPRPFLPASSSGHFNEMEDANEANQLEFIDRYLEERIGIDLWWMDAGWYVTPDRWWKVGTWEVDPRRFPNGLKPITDHAHRNGLQALVWFEPERVHPGTWLYENHPEWLLGKEGENKLLDLGNPEARAWLVEHIDGLIREQGVDLYRQDFNMPALPFWRANDAPDRRGITEIRHVEGYLAYWDELRQRHPGMLLDTCASGGRRLDLETLRRSVPLHKSDHDYGDYAARQSQLYGISFWIPFHGAPVCRADKVDTYAFRSGLAPMTGLGYDVRRRDLDYAHLRRPTGEWREVVHCFLGDYYPLTPYTCGQQDWLAWQFDRPDLGEGLVQAFRRAESPYTQATFHLRNLDPKATYEVRDYDAESPREVPGRVWAEEGLTVTLAERPAAALLRYRRTEGPQTRLHPSLHRNR